MHQFKPRSAHVLPLVLMATLGLLSAGLVHAAGTGGGGGGIAPSSGIKPKTPEQIAASQYKSGLKQKAKALKAEAKIPEAKNAKAAARLTKRAQKAFAKAAEHHKRVLQVDPRHYEAANELGFALRKTGDYKNAIGAYNYALQIKPDFLEAIEYRGEAFMSLGYYQQAKESYLRLYRDDQTLASELMTRMSQWLERKSEDGETLTEEEQAFADWVRERKRLVGFSVNPDAQPSSGRW